jgi:hypothetical protein
VFSLWPVVYQFWLSLRICERLPSITAIRHIQDQNSAEMGWIGPCPESLRFDTPIGENGPLVRNFLDCTLPC